IEMNATNINTENDAGEKTAWLEIVRRQVGSLRFGVVQIVVHDSQVTQIEKTERVRLDRTRGQTF
ncbi:MAG TPA: YezD family protein, partial [Verrucomicrobiae bacterium]